MKTDRKFYNPNEGTARSRIAILRQTHSNMGTCAPSHRHGLFDGRYLKFTDPAPAMHSSGTIELAAIAGLRDLGDADQVEKAIAHKGWFVDEYQEDCYRGHVWQLPARNGQRQYVAGYIDDIAELARLDMRHGSPVIYSDEYEAARAADELARVEAEKRRDWNAAQSALERARDELDTRRSAIRNDVRELRELREVLGDARVSVADRLASQIESAWEAYREAHDTVREAAANLAQEERRLTA